MSRSLRREDGFTMVELLLVCVISLVIFGATTTAWTSVYNSNRVVERQQENAESARVALDRAARQLRNLANPTVNAVTTIDRATDYDFIFQTSDPSKTWVRYCLEPGVDRGTLWESENDNTTAISGQMRGPCPGTGWQRKTAVVTGVTNQAGGIDRNVFNYECSVDAPVTCPASDAEYPRITNVGINLWVDADRTDRASELNVATSVFLRNQNEGPTSAISGPDPARIGPEKVLLNGSGSSDPEGRTLEYFWFEGAAPTAAELAATACTATPPNVAWQGVTFSKKFDVGTAGQSATFHLLVRDPGCLTDMSSITFEIPT